MSDTQPGDRNIGWHPSPDVLLDDIRTRIAAALFDAADAGTWRIAEMNREDAALLADAVIAELGLEKQSHYDPGCNYHRWVTDWKADQ